MGIRKVLRWKSPALLRNIISASEVIVLLILNFKVFMNVVERRGSIHVLYVMGRLLPRGLIYTKKPVLCSVIELGTDEMQTRTDGVLK